MIETVVTADWLERLVSYQRLFVGFSGGLDSTVLLHSLAAYPSLHTKLYAVHVHHGLSIHADTWQSHCQQFCDRLGIPLLLYSITFPRNANIEENARKARYQVFDTLLEKEDALLLAHHQQDQAETLLLQLVRGTGIEGLAAMPSMKKGLNGIILRPLLTHPRTMLEQYARRHQLTWIEDESNQDVSFSRNYIRHQIMPLLTQKWPSVLATLARCADHHQQAKANLRDLAYLDYPGLQEMPDTLRIDALRDLNGARISNILRVWLQGHGISCPSTSTFNRIIKEVIQAASDAMPYVAWSKYSIRRYQNQMYLLKIPPATTDISSQVWEDFPNPLLSSRFVLHATLATEGVIIQLNSRVEVRFRVGGESFYWRGQTKSLKKLLQQWQVAPWLRDTIPLLYVDGNLAVVVGYAVSDQYVGKGQQAKGACVYQINLMH